MKLRDKFKDKNYYMYSDDVKYKISSLKSEIFMNQNICFSCLCLCFEPSNLLIHYAMRTYT